MGDNFTESVCHIDSIKPGDTVRHKGDIVTVGAKDLKHDPCMGRTLRGDSYRLGTLPVIKITYQVVGELSKYTGAQPGEVFVGNVETKNGIPRHLLSLQTIRLGDLALDIYGNPLDPGDMLPMFIHEREQQAHHRLCMKHTFPNQHVY